MNISQQLIESLDNAMLKRTYKAFMNYYYLKAAYDLGVGDGSSAPPEIDTVIRTSKFYDLLSDEGSGGAIVTTRKDLEQFVADLNDVATLYKKRLSQNLFNSPTYKDSLKAINRDKRSSVRIRNGYEDFGIREGVKVYEVEQDIFDFFFIEENGKLRALTLGIGD